MDIRVASEADKMQVVLMVILLFAVYLFFVQWMKQNVQREAQVIPAAIVIGFIFVCIAVAIIFMAHRLNEQVIALLTVLLALSALQVFCFVRIVKEEKDKINKAALVAFLAYVLIILCATVLLREQNTNKTIQRQAFSAVQTAIAGEGDAMLQHMLLNFVLFVPYGFLLTMIYPEKLDRVLISLMAGIALSTFAETMQMVFQSGMCDLDDIIANSVGTVVGQLAYTPLFQYVIPKLIVDESEDEQENRS